MGRRAGLPTVCPSGATPWAIQLTVPFGAQDMQNNVADTPNKIVVYNTLSPKWGGELYSPRCSPSGAASCVSPGVALKGQTWGRGVQGFH
jgi:hypothetical protein